MTNFIQRDYKRGEVYAMMCVGRLIWGGCMFKLQGGLNLWITKKLSFWYVKPKKTVGPLENMLNIDHFAAYYRRDEDSVAVVGPVSGVWGGTCNLW